MRSAGRYELVTRLASGHSGDIYLGHYSSVFLYGHDGAEDRAFAVKVIKPDLARLVGYRSVLAREAPGAIAFEHVAAVRTFEVVAASADEVFIAMDFAFGQSLATLLQHGTAESRPTPPDVLAWITLQTASALHLAHHTAWAAGEQSPIIHGSLSPQSIMVRHDGSVAVLGVGTGRSKLCVAPSLAALAYRAPELIDRSGTDRRADIYSLGLILHDALTGQRSFKRRTFDETQAAVLRHSVAPLASARSDLGTAIVELIGAMIDPVRANRPKSMTEVQRVLERAIGGSPAEAAERLRAYAGALFPGEMRGQRRMVDAMLRPPPAGEPAPAPHAVKPPSVHVARPPALVPAHVLEEHDDVPHPISTGARVQPELATAMDWSVRAATGDLQVPRARITDDEARPPRSEWSVRALDPGGRSADLEVRGSRPEERRAAPAPIDDPPSTPGEAPPPGDLVPEVVLEADEGGAPPGLISFPPPPASPEPSRDIGEIALELFHRLGGSRGGDDQNG